MAREALPRPFLGVRIVLFVTCGRWRGHGGAGGGKAASECAGVSLQKGKKRGAKSGFSRFCKDGPPGVGK